MAKLGALGIQVLAVDITLHAVEAVVPEGDGLKTALPGMSFLNRTEMKRDGQALTLIRRY